MNKLIDKLIILIFCIVFYIPNGDESAMIVPILISVIISSILSYLEADRFQLSGFLLFILICFFDPMLLFFCPLICYDILFFKIKWIWTLALVPIFVNFMRTLSIANLLIVSFIIVAYLLKYRTLSIHRVKNENFQLRDQSKELSIKYLNKNKELMEKQDYEVNLATLNERNRIARDIHDNVGHMLSRSMLQIGALLVTSKDITTNESLTLIKDTLSGAMDSIRNSVHDLHDESIDLYTEIRSLIDHFDFCPVSLEYDMESIVGQKLKYCFIAVIKEALSNIIKHSNATNAFIILREHPALFQLVIQDNGTQSHNKSENGIGLKNIADRVSAFDGNLNFNHDKGFRIFISIPKYNK